MKFLDAPKGTSSLKGKRARAEITQETGPFEDACLLVACRHPTLGGLIENSSLLPSGAHRAHIRAGQLSAEKIEVAMFGILIQSIWAKILFAMARGLMIFHLK